MNLFQNNILLLLALHTLLPFCSTEAALTQNLKYYETLHATTATHKIVKRGLHDSQHPYNKIKEIEFATLGRNFRLILSPSHTILHPNFKAYVMDASGNENHVAIEREQFFKGRVFGEAKSHVDLHVDEDGVMMGSIHVPDEIYHVEPMWRHLPDDFDNRTMITYRESDVKLSWENFDLDLGHFFQRENATDGIESATDWVLQGHSRNKRQTNENGNLEFKKTRCPLLLVADYRFYREMGGGNNRTTINYLISLIDRVHKMYNDTIWQDGPNVAGFGGFGFVIKKILVHSAPTYTYDGREHYNMQRREWDVRRLLEVFSRNAENKDYCLSHLFTHQTFDNRVVLGLAYIASDRLTSPGGICSIEYTRERVPLYLNAGLSSSRTHYGQRVITREADLVTAHEFGHNWGSEHDPDTDECSPSARHGGSYLMYTYSVSGYDFNNKQFSPCSKRAIKKVLQAKSQLCFTEPQESFCGNLKVEGDEECDAGLLGTEGNDRCCDKDCKLKKRGSFDKNFPCCEMCEFLPAGVKCRDAQYATCEQEAFCNGESAICPKSTALPDGTECQERGKCINGTCTSFCETEGMESCMCDRGENACKRCCRSDTNSTCTPIEPDDILPDGTPCIQGFCNNGKCEKVVQDVVERFWKIIDDININKLLLFLRDNIVGTVIIVTAVLWIPAAYIINRVDEQRNVEEKERWSWTNSTDFVYTEDPAVLHVRPPRTRYRVLPPGSHPVVTAVIPE